MRFAWLAKPAYLPMKKRAAPTYAGFYGGVSDSIHLFHLDRVLGADSNYRQLMSVHAPFVSLSLKRTECQKGLV